jgi:hypothetical protein
MKFASNLFLRLTVLSLFSLTVFSSFSATACAQASDKTILSRTADVDGLKMHYLTIGHGSTNLILLHGYAENSHMWRPIMPMLAEKFTVIAPDLPGIGESGIPASGLDMKCSHQHSCASQVIGCTEG